ncbi:MAG: hypothetical protein JW966_04545 [Anaerolineae bacterium]|nr:hypothetical protein [Anaerolineae bacterium]
MMHKPAHESRRVTALQTLLLLALIVALAAVFRLVDLERAPVGGHGDVAWVGINALDWLDNGVRPFYVREMYAPEFIVVYVVGILAELTEISFLPSRLMTVTSGLLMVVFLFPATWWLLDGQPDRFRRRAGLLAALSGAVSLHAAYLSRLGMESPPFMAVVTLLVWLTAWAWARHGWWRWALAGAALALAQYIYLPARLLPVVLALWIVHAAWADRDRLRSLWRGWVILAAVACVLTLPALILFITTPEAFTSRADAGSAATGGWIWKYDMRGEGGLIVMLIKKISLTLQAFGIAWDGPYTVMDQPMLAPLFFVGLLVVVGAVIRWPRHAAYAWPVLAIPVMLFTDLISGAVVEIHALHQMGVLPFVFILSGIGLALLWEPLAARIPRTRGRLALGGVILAAGVLPSLAGLVHYLDDVIPGQYADPETGWREEQIDVDLSRRLLDEPDRAYLVPYEEYNRSNIAWLLSDAFRTRRSAIDAAGILRVPALPDDLSVLIAADPFRPRHDARAPQFDRRLWVLCYDGEALLLPPLTVDQVGELDRFLNTAQTEAIIDRSDTTIGTLYTGPTPPDWFAPRDVIEFPLDASFHGGDIRLLGYTLPDRDLTPGALTTITLFWQAQEKRPGEDYEIFVQVWNDAGWAIASTHDFPYDGMYRSRIWDPGEVVATHHWVMLPDDLPFGRYTLVTGLYRLLHNERVSVSGVDTDPGQNIVRVPDLRRPLPPDPAFDPGTPPPQVMQFGDVLDVIGLDMTLDGVDQAVGDTFEAQPGQTLTLAIAWEALARPPQDYSLFLHLSADDDIPPTAQADLTLGGGYPTRAWRSGDRMRDQVALALPADLQPGTYTLWLGVYFWQTGERLPAVVDGSPQPDARFRLGTVTVR